MIEYNFSKPDIKRMLPNGKPTPQGDNWGHGWHDKKYSERHRLFEIRKKRYAYLRDVKGMDNRQASEELGIGEYTRVQRWYNMNKEH